MMKPRQKNEDLEMFELLTRLQLALRTEKTFMGRHREGYDLLGYYITPQGLSPNTHAQEKALKIARRRYAQGGILSLQEYFKRWRTWVHAGLPSVDIHTVNTIIDSLKHQIMLDKGLLRAERRTKTGPDLFSACNGQNKLQKGRQICVQNFSRHSQ